MNDKNEEFIVINNINYNIQNIEVLAWKKIVNGSTKRKNGFRTMCVGTINEDNSTSLRTVINRKADELNKTIFFYTDNRSRKFYELQKDNRISLLFYDAKQKTQIVIKAIAELHSSNSLTNDKWKTTTAQSRLGYMTTEPPNSKSIEPTIGYDKKFSAVKPTNSESDLFEKNFSVISCKAYELEFLYLDFNGNYKATFHYENGILKDFFWAVP